MRLNILILISCLTAALCEKIIISFKDDNCEKIGFNHIHAIKKLASSVSPLIHIGMIIADLDLEKLHRFLELNLEFSNCINPIAFDEEVKLTLPERKTPNDQDLDQWHLKRTNVKSLPLPASFKRKITSSNTANVYLIDSGIDGLHPDLKPRLATGSDEHASFVEADVCCSKPFDPLCDCGAHGSHCAGLIASPHSGYNPNATLHSIKIFDSNLSSKNSIILQGMNKAIEISKKHQGEVNIVSMSLGGLFNLEINQAANKIVQASLFLVTSAGNDSSNSCLKSPASASRSFTVGASDSNDQIADFSNFGKCVKIFAPGVNINSCKPGGGYQYLSGTSMATPFVAGFASAIAANLGLTNPSDIENAVNQNLSDNVVQDAKSDHNSIPYDGQFKAANSITYLK